MAETKTTTKKATTKKSDAIDYSTMNIHQKIALLRKQVLESELKKSGVNSYAKFNYYQLDDILPVTIDLMSKIGLTTSFDINSEKASLTVYNVDERVEVRTENFSYFGYDSVEFTTHVAEDVGQIKNPIQKLGSQHTYIKRYLYLNFLELVESDTIDALTGAPEKNLPKPSKEKPKGKSEPTQKDSVVDTALLKKELGTLIKEKDLMNDKEKMQEITQGKKSTEMTVEELKECIKKAKEI